ncbi:hypothetical protein BZG35_16785 [Brevundimonas sp. LM2]|nr:hypothetical protein BZG35_16785 [Brevundimonas sp. LM2]
MPSYVFQLRARSSQAAQSETVEAVDDEEAQDLAFLRLNLSQAFTQVQVERAGREIFRLTRAS